MIFVIAEHKDNKLKPITSELLVFAQRAGRDFGQPITAIILGSGTAAAAWTWRTRSSTPASGSSSGATGISTATW